MNYVIEGELKKISNNLNRIANSLDTLVRIQRGQLVNELEEEFNPNPTFEEQCEINGVKPGVDFPWV